MSGLLSSVCVEPKIYSLDRIVDLYLTTSGHFPLLLPTKAILASPIFNVLGGECVFQSTIFTLTSGLTSEYVQR